MKNSILKFKKYNASKSILLLLSGVLLSIQVNAESNVYGKLNISWDRAELENGTRTSNETRHWELNSNASRLGVKGTKEIAESLDILYKIEFEVYADDGAKSKTLTDSNDDKLKVKHVLGQRNIYVGLKGAAGTIKAGKFDTPLKSSQGKFDLFGDMTGDIKQVMSGEARSSDLIQYTSPKFLDGLTLNMAVQPGEEFDDSVSCEAATTNCDDDGKFDAYSTSAVYSKDAIYAALAFGKDIKDEDIEKPFKTSDSKQDITRITTLFKQKKYTTGFMYQKAKETSHAAGSKARTETSLALSGYFNATDKIKLKLQYVMVDIEGLGLKDDENTLLTLGTDYKLGKKTKLFAYHTSLINDDKETGSHNEKETVLGAGLIHSF